MSDRDSRILGCMVGNTIGDAFGGVAEFFTEEKLRKKVPGLWLDDFLPYNEDHGTHPLGLWETGPPRGTGTDDTRNNQMFADCVVRNKGFVNSQVLAIEYIEAYRDREVRYPKHADLAEQHYRGIYERACAHLGMVDLSTGRKGPAVAACGNGFPTLHGVKAFPDDWTRDAVQANRKVYGIDLEQSAAHFSKAVFG